MLRALWVCNVAALMVLAAFLGSCKDITVNSVPVEDVALSATSVSLQVGETRQLTATPKGAGQNLTGRPVSWRSSNQAVATVDGTGMVRAVGAGSATITATAEDVPATATIVVTAPQPPQIVLSAASLSFTAVRGQATPAAQQVNITNGGAGTLSGLTGVVTYGAGASNWLNASLNSTTAPATLTIQPSTANLAPGTYTAEVTLRSTVAGVAENKVSVTYVVAAAPQPQIGVSTSAVSFRTDEGGPTPGPQQVAVTNVGSGTLTGLNGIVTYGPGASNWLKASLNSTTAPATLTIDPTTTLAPGTYTAEVTLRSDIPGVADNKVAVTYFVSPKPQPQIGLSTSAVSFSAVQGQTVPGAQQVTVTNIGSGTLNGLSASVTYGAGASGWLNANLSSATAPSTLTIQPSSTSLQPGTYTAEVVIRSAASGVVESKVGVTYVVTASPQPQIGLSTSAVSFSAVQGQTVPDGQQITVTNIGSGTLSGLNTAVAYGPGASGWLNVNLNSTTAPATLTIRPSTTSLAPGTYTATVAVRSTASGVAEKTVTVTYVISAVPSAPAIIFHSDRDGDYEIYAMNPDGTGLTQLTTNTGADDRNPAWARSGNKIAFTSDRGGNFDIYTMNADGTGVISLTPGSPARDIEPTWSPDGSKIAFASDRDGDFDIYVVNTDGTGLRQLTNNTSFEGVPSWSPDGSTIAFASDRDGDLEIFVMNPDGTAQTQLTRNTAGEFDPRWSPDGRKLTYGSYSGTDGRSHIFVMNADGTGQTQLTQGPWFDFNPTWSPDGNKIAFSSTRDGNLEIYVMNADGTLQTRLTAHPASDGYPDWRR